MIQPPSQSEAAHLYFFFVSLYQFPVKGKEKSALMESASKHFPEERMQSCIKCFLPLACIHPPTCAQPAAATQFGEIDLNNMKLDKRTEQQNSGVLQSSD